MAATASGVTVPGPDPTIVPATPIEDLWNDLGESLNGKLVVYVATEAARAALVTALAGEGYTVSASAPLYVHRADAGTGRHLEVSIDGTNWRTILSHSPVPQMMTWKTATSSYTGATLVDCGTTLTADSDQTTSGAAFATVSGVVVTIVNTGLYMVGVGGELAVAEGSGRYFVQGTLSRALPYGELRVNLIPENQGVACMPMLLTAGDTITAQMYGSSTGKTVRCSISLARLWDQ